MDKYKILSGEQIVEKGATKLEATLPEIGLKDVTPNYSWLEQKQIHSALEARKQLVEVERIDKSGVLTHAVWCEDVKLARVTQQAGSYWQFLGHQKDSNTLYLKPEETLFLMEVNCLLLRNNDAIVSLQQAYSLLLPNQMSVIKYRVYSSLSRLGYKVFSHTPKSKDIKPNTVTSQTLLKESGTQNDGLNDNSIKNKSEDTLSADVKEEPADIQNNISDHEKSIDANATDHAEKSEINSSGAILDSTETENSSQCSENPKYNDELKLVKEENNLIDMNNSTTQIPTVKSELQQNASVDEVDFASKFDVRNESLENEITCDNKNVIIDADEPEQKPTTYSSRTILNEPENISHNSMEFREKPIADCIVIEENDAGHDLQPGNSYQEEINEVTSTNMNTQKCSQGPSNSGISIEPMANYSQAKLNKLKSSRLKRRPISDIHKSFKNFPNILGKQTIVAFTPKQVYLPKSIVLNKLRHSLNVESVRSKTVRLPPSASVLNGAEDEDENNFRRVNTFMQFHPPRPPTINTGFQNVNFYQNFRPDMPFRHFWRPRPHLGYFQFNLFFNRPYFTTVYPRHQFYPRMQNVPTFSRPIISPSMNRSVNNELVPLQNSNDSNSNGPNRKRPKTTSSQNTYLETLKTLALRLKNMVASGIVRPQNEEALQSLIKTYNLRYRTNVRLSKRFEIIGDDGDVVDTITLDDEAETSNAKKPRLDDQSDDCLKNLDKIREIALKLKKLESENRTTTRHRRALASVIKTFNKQFNADIHLTDNYEVIDRRCISLDSSSDSDCVIEEPPKEKSGKKLRNPFNILKKLSEKQCHVMVPTTSREELPNFPIEPKILNHYEVLQKCFKKPWLPGIRDFGRPEIISRNNMTARFVETKKEELMFDFLKGQSYIFRNWTEVKMAFLKNIEETNAFLHTEAMLGNDIDIQCLVKPDDCKDMKTVLEKLSIIPVNKTIKDNQVLAIDYDVYNRDVKNFRKTDRPTPHFRLVCIDESSSNLTATDIATLHAKLEDDVTVLFAIVGISSISFLQMNPTDLPVYLP